MRLQALRHVVGVEHGLCGGSLQPGGPQHLDVHPRDRQDGGRALWRCRHGTLRLAHHTTPVPRRRDNDMAGKERRQTLHDADAAYTRTATAVGDTERFVQVQVAHVGTQVTGAGVPHLRVHVGAIHVHQAAQLMHQVVDFDDSIFKHAVCGRVGDL